MFLHRKATKKECILKEKNNVCKTLLKNIFEKILVTICHDLYKVLLFSAVL